MLPVAFIVLHRKKLITPRISVDSWELYVPVSSLIPPTHQTKKHLPHSFIHARPSHFQILLFKKIKTCCHNFSEKWAENTLVVIIIFREGFKGCKS